MFARRAKRGSRTPSGRLAANAHSSSRRRSGPAPRRPWRATSYQLPLQRSDREQVRNPSLLHGRTNCVRLDRAEIEHRPHRRCHPETVALVTFEVVAGPVDDDVPQRRRVVPLHDDLHRRLVVVHVPEVRSRPVRQRCRRTSSQRGPALAVKRRRVAGEADDPGLEADEQAILDPLRDRGLRDSAGLELLDRRRAVLRGHGVPDGHRHFPCSGNG